MLHDYSALVALIIQNLLVNSLIMFSFIIIGSISRVIHTTLTKVLIILPFLFLLTKVSFFLLPFKIIMHIFLINIIHRFHFDFYWILGHGPLGWQRRLSCSTQGVIFRAR